ncbi:hypothetical protein ZWY2020_050929, partial [Hordeum vulgare]
AVSMSLGFFPGQGLNKDLRKMISDHADLKALTVKDIITASDGTRKMLSVIETVVILSARGRTTVCVSSQVGCAMNCQFCFTGRMGLRKHLSTAEIVEQAVFARKLFSDEFGSITNVPLHNVDNVIKASSIMVDEQGLQFSPRRLLYPQVELIMPINRKYNLSTLLGTLREELCLRPKSIVLFEYVMLAGVNDRAGSWYSCKINSSLSIPIASQFKPTPGEKIIEFRNMLIQSGLTAMVRLSRGED